MSTDITYEAAVYTRDVTYKNFKGEEKTTTLHFALDPIQLMQIIASFGSKKPNRSGNPAKKNAPVEFSDEDQLKFVRDLAKKSAGAPSDDGESWLPFEDFDEHIAGKAFLTKLASSDGDRKEFSEKVIVEPFRAFVSYASADPSNTPKEVQQFQKMLGQIENIFKVPDNPSESVEERRARLAAELESLGNASEES